MNTSPLAAETIPGDTATMLPPAETGAAAHARPVGCPPDQPAAVAATLYDVDQRPAARRSWPLRLARRIAKPMARRAARAYLAGDSLADALRVQSQLAQERRCATLGYWNAVDECPRAVLGQYLAAIPAVQQNQLGGTVSVKLPGLAFDADLVSELGAAARAHGVLLHCDSHGPDLADSTCGVIEAWRAAGNAVGTTLPGRWLRSLDDSLWAARQQVSVRVVKGQWADPLAPQRDPRTGYLEVIDRLAGRARFVSVATHDVPLAAEAIGRLRRAGTRCNLELLYGLPLRASLRLARELDIGVRLYVPYGSAYLPYALSKLKENPRLLLRLAKDVLRIRG